MEEISKKITGALTISPEILTEIKTGVKNISDFKEEIENIFVTKTASKYNAMYM